jgi:lysophospholipase L1-like esterase
MATQVTVITGEGSTSYAVNTGSRGPQGVQGIPGTSATVDQTIIDGSTNAVAGNAVFDALAIKAPLASPTFTGIVTAPRITGRCDGLEVLCKAGLAINAGQVVYVTGASGNNIIIGLAQANAELTSSKTIGISESTLANNATGYVITEGLLTVSISAPTANEGDPIWLSPSTAGGMVFGAANKPVAPNHMVYLGVVTRKTGNTVVEIFVKVQNGSELEELADVSITSPAAGQALMRGATLWQNRLLTSSDISDSTAAGRTILTAANAAAQITALGAETPSGAQTKADSVLNTLAPGATGDFTLVMEGDSITEGVTNGGATVGNYLQDRLALEGYFSGRASIFNVATSGNTIANVVSQYTSQVYPYRPSANAGKRAVLLLLIGTNDSTTLATQITNAASVLSYCATARADGFEVWLCTLLPRNVTPNYWTPFNNALREGESYDKLIDYATLFADTTTWTGDNLHPNNLGYRILASFVNGRAYSKSIRDGFNHGSMGKQDSDAVIITGGTFSGSTGTFTGTVTRTSTGASNAEFASQAIGAGGSRQWLYGHIPNATGNLPVNSFAMTYYNGTAFESSLAGFSPNGGIVSNQARLVARTVANLSLLSATIGNKALVNDALLPVISAIVAGGGAKLCEVTYNGTNWIVTSILN